MTSDTLPRVGVLSGNRARATQQRLTGAPAYFTILLAAACASCGGSRAEKLCASIRPGSDYPAALASAFGVAFCLVLTSDGRTVKAVDHNLD